MRTDEWNYTRLSSFVYRSCIFSDSFRRFDKATFVFLRQKIHINTYYIAWIFWKNRWNDFKADDFIFAPKKKLFQFGKPTF